MAMVDEYGILYSLALESQSVKEKNNSDFKPAILH